MTKVLFAGCSYTAGVGLPGAHQDPDLWVNRLCHSGLFGTATSTNCSQGGRSNQGIFQDTAWQITQHQYDFALVAWTSVPRYEMELGLELYDTRQAFMPNLRTREHKLNDLVYDQQYLQRINDRFTSLAHPHHEIVNLVCYVNILTRLCQLRGTRIFFINAICPWDDLYFQPLQQVLPESYTAFTKSILNLETRSDQEIFALYHKLHTDYDQAGGIQAPNWLNLYESLHSLQTDTNNDGIHPGIQSNQVYHDTLAPRLQALI